MALCVTMHIGNFLKLTFLGKLIVRKVQFVRLLEKLDYNSKVFISRTFNS